MSDWKEPEGSEGFPDEDGATPPWAPESSFSPSPPAGRLGGGRIWPVAVALSLFVVVCVNLAFIYIAVSGADEVVPSYVQGER